MTSLDGRGYRAVTSSQAPTVPAGLIRAATGANGHHSAEERTRPSALWLWARPLWTGGGVRPTEDVSSCCNERGALMTRPGPPRAAKVTFRYVAFGYFTSTSGSWRPAPPPGSAIDE